MDARSLPTLPPGWVRKVSERGQVTYKCSQICINSLKILRQFHQEERFIELTESMVVFGKQKRRNFSNEDIGEQSDLKKTKEAGEEDICCEENPSGEEVVCDELQYLTDTIASDCNNAPSASLPVCELEVYKKKKLDLESKKLNDAVEKLTIDPSRTIDHKGKPHI